jgi:hypothetical protein
MANLSEAASAPLSPDAIDADATGEVVLLRLEKDAEAYKAASNLILASRILLLALGLSLVPVDSPGPVLDEARRWWRQSFAIWCLAIVATPILFFLRFHGAR